ncbi:MAG: hypothetical protein FOGNACKC_03980 [Anaerolineae bacterium]|nr:hypothetical protein [Anaerolineae bacterium]
MPRLSVQKTAAPQPWNQHPQSLVALLDVSRNVAATLELETLLRLILEQLKTVIDYTDSAILTIEPGGGLKIVARQGESPHTHPLDACFSAQTLKEHPELFNIRKPLIFADTRLDSALFRTFRRISQQCGLDLSRLRSWMGVPLIVKEQLIGLLSIGHTEPNHYPPHFAELAMAFAYQAAAAIENASLYSKAKRHADEMETLLAIQSAIISRLDSERVLQLVADAAWQFTGTHLSLVYLVDGDSLRIATISGQTDREKLVGYGIPLARSVAGSCIRTGEPMIIGDTRTDPRIYPDITERLGMRCYMTVPLHANDQPIGVLAVANEEPFSLGAEQERILLMLAPTAVMGLENARLYREEYQRRLEAERRRHIAESLRGILTILNTNRPLAEVLDTIAVQASKLLDSQAVTICGATEPDDGMRYLATFGLPPEITAAAGGSLISPDFFGQTSDSPQPVTFTDLNAALAGLPPENADSAFFSRLAGPYRSLLAAPLVIKGNLFGQLLLFHQQPRQFTATEIELAATFADQAALAIENVLLKAQVEKTAVATERSRLAHELHDSVTQTLFSANLIAKVLPRVWENRPAEAHAGLDELQQLTRGALAEMRTLLLELRPTAVTECGLDVLLQHLTAAMSGRTRAPINLHTDGECSLPPPAQLALYRIAQEALNNVAKHARAEQVTVSLRCSAGGVELEISDDGLGFDPAAIPPDHLGVRIMGERAQKIGASLQLNSRPGFGTQIHVSWQNSTDEDSQ